jgi:hypothetical protein
MKVHKLWHLMLCDEGRRRGGGRRRWGRRLGRKPYTKVEAKKHIMLRGIRKVNKLHWIARE